MKINNFHQLTLASFTVVLLNILSVVLSAPTTESVRNVTTASSGQSRYVMDTDSLDANKDGCISGKAELDAFIAHVSSLLPKTTSNMLKARSIVYRSDVNRDGKICWCDFVAIYLQDRDSKRRHTAPFAVVPDNAMFLHLDADHDGQLQGKEKEDLENEFSSCLGSLQAKLIIQSMEEKVRRDDVISLEEYERYLSGAPKQKAEALTTVKP